MPVLKKIINERDHLGAECMRLQAELNNSRSGAEEIFAPPGHFYSPIPSIEDVKNEESKIFDTFSKVVAGVELHDAEQLMLLDEFVKFYGEMPFSAEKKEGFRYYFENPAYSYSDGIFLHCMIRYLKPERIIEVGSGFSSCMTLDTNEFFFNGSINTTFIEPYPELFFSLIKEQDKEKVKTIPSRLQDVSLSEFEKLKSNDILFIDSTHVSKINSDVNYIIFKILPRLAPGVYIHFHDIFFPFEYPKPWIYEGRAWNEAYLLKAFLQYNNSFRIVVMNTYMQRYYNKFFEENLPLCLKNRGGSIWIRKE